MEVVAAVDARLEVADRSHGRARFGGHSCKFRWLLGRVDSQQLELLLCARFVFITLTMRLLHEMRTNLNKNKILMFI